MVLSQLGYTHKKIKLDLRLISYVKINSKWIKHLNGKIKSIKLLEENVAVNISDFGFLYITPKGQATEKKKKKVD